MRTAEQMRAAAEKRRHADYSPACREEAEDVLTLLAQRDALLSALSDLYDIVDRAACPIDDYDEWRRQVMTRAGAAVTQARSEAG